MGVAEVEVRDGKAGLLVVEVEVVGLGVEDLEGEAVLGAMGSEYADVDEDEPAPEFVVVPVSASTSFGKGNTNFLGVRYLDRGISGTET